MEDVLSQLPSDRNQNTTHDLNYLTETMWEIYDTDKLPEENFPITFKIIDQYLRKYPFLTDKFIFAIFKCRSFRGERNNNFNFIMCNDKCLFRQNYKDTHWIIIISISFVLEWIGQKILFTNTCTGRLDTIL